MFSIFLFASYLLLTQCQSIQPAAIPLAVRSPYFQSYLSHTSTTSGTNTWPSFWTTNHTLGWSGLLRVDGTLYEWLGSAVEDGGLTIANNATAKAVTLQNYQITPTRSILSLQAGAMDINVTFLSPIEPADLALQSFPFTYIYFEASSTDGNSHSLQVYEDISGEWTSSSTTNIVQWNTTTSNSITYHQAQRSPFQFMTETNDMAEDATVYHVTNSGSGVTFQTGEDLVVRSRFLNNGSLANSQDTTFREISDNWPVFAFCKDFGTISSTSAPLVWGIGLVRNGNIIYTTTAGNQTRHPYFLTKYADVATAMANFMNDATNALERSKTLDSKIVSDANAISSNYVDLVSLASRQLMAGLEVTVGTDSSGKLNASDILFFMKDTGNSQRTNPVEAMYASFPGILYLNASWAGYLLKPLMQLEQSGLYSLSFAAGDLGNSFPVATGNANPTVFSAMESSSDMISMMWAYATFSGDGTLISQYYSTLKTWTDTLISENPLTPNGYISADGLSSANMTNLAIKGILAIRTMAEISKTLGNSDDYNSYSSQASSLVSQWQNIAGSSGHLSSTYGSSNSWAMIYNLYPDKLFGFDFVDDSIYQEQTSWYASEASSALSFGLPFDSNEANTAKSHWTLFTAGTVTDTSTRNSLVSMVHSSAANLKNFAPFPTTYNTSDGTIQGGTASPAQGAMFALLALNLQKQTITSLGSASSKSHVGAIVGGVVGAVVVVALIIIAGFLYRRRRSRRGIRE
ncbi:putative glutaminase A, partial [Lentinula edodes]